MRGCRPYSAGEFSIVESSFAGRFSVRNRALFVFGSFTGFRIGEIRSLRVGDVYQFERVVDSVSVRRSAMKGKIASRTVILHSAVKCALKLWLDEMKAKGWLTSDVYLFKSQMGRNRPITNSQAARILKRNFRAHRMLGKLSCHSMRKFFAESVFQRLGGDLVKLQQALGHSCISSTVHYLSFKQDDINQAILSI